MERKSSSKSPQRSPEANEARERAKEAIQKRNRKPKPFYEKYAYHIVIGLFVLVIVYGVINSLFRGGPNIQTTDVNDEALIALRNSGDSTFKVGPVPFFNGYKLADAKLLFNNQPTNKQQLYYCRSAEKASIISERYNFYEAHPECVRKIIEQGNCSSSYSIATISAINDRYCLQSLQNKEEIPILSAQTPIACDKVINSQCKGGYVSRTLDYAKIYGLVEESCLPYEPQSIDKNYDCTSKTSQCKKFKIADYCVSSSEDAMKQEIFNHGPIIAVIPVYRDFLIYKEGLYQVYPKTPRFPAGHAVKIIGWDNIEGKNCWLIENSWGEKWGVNGTACVLANQEELDIERFSIAPSLVLPEKPEDEKEEGDAENIQVNLDEIPEDAPRTNEQEVPTTETEM